MTTESITEQAVTSAEGRLQEAGSRFLTFMEALPPGVTLTDLLLASDFVGYERVGGRYNSMRDLRPNERTYEVRRSRIYRRRNPLADRAIGLWTEACYETPWTYTATDKSFQPLIDGLTSAKANKRVFSWSARKRLSNALLTDGELPFVFFVGNDSVKVRTRDPLEFLDPVTNPDDQDEIWYWPRQWYGSDGVRHLWLYRDWDFVDDDGRPRTEPIPQADRQRLSAFVGLGDVELRPRDNEYACVLAINSEGLRGYPLMTSGLDWLKRHQDFLIDRASLTAERAKYATKVSVDGTQKHVDAIRSTLERPDPADIRDGLRPPAAQTWVANRGVDMELVQAVADGQSAREDERALRMMATMPSGVPPHLMGDVGEGNLATAAATEKPLRSMLKSYQGLLMEHDQEILSHVGQWLRYTGDTSADIDAPDILGQSLLELAQLVSSVAGTFPAVKRSEEVLSYLLTEMGLNNVDDIIDEIRDYLQDDVDAQEVVGKAIEALREARARMERTDG